MVHVQMECYLEVVSTGKQLHVCRCGVLVNKLIDVDSISDISDQTSVFYYGFGFYILPFTGLYLWDNFKCYTSQGCNPHTPGLE